MLTQFQLKNGLKVLMFESHKAPVVAVQMWVKTGSADERKGEEGISHFIEHLVFKGTRKYGVGEIAKTIEGSGGELNAYTTFDHTVFHVTISKEEMNIGLDCIGEMMGFPKFDEGEIDKEREVVIEEIKRSEDSASHLSTQRLFSNVFNKHPYGTPVIGYASNIKKVSPKVLKKYYESRYVPTNMTLVVTGDFEKKSLKKQIEQIYGEFPKYKLAKRTRVNETKQNKLKIDYHPTNFHEISINVAFKVPGAKHADVPALDVIGTILGSGDTSRLVRRLRLENPLVTGISAGSFNPLDPGLFAISVGTKVDNVEEVIKIIGEELESLVSTEPSFQELERAKLNLESDEIYGVETVDGLARKIGFFQTMLGSPEYVDVYLRRIQNLTPADVVKVARKYFLPKGISANITISKKDTKTLPAKKFSALMSGIADGLSRGHKQKIVKTKGVKKKIKPLKIKTQSMTSKNPIEKIKLNNNTLVILKKNPEIPILHMKTAFLGGLRNESDNHLGVTNVLSNTWTSGTPTKSEHDISNVIESCAGVLSAFGGRNSIGMTLETLSIYQEKALDLWSDVIANANFPQDEVKRELAVQYEHIRTREDHPSSVAAQIFMENMFVGHPYAKDLLGTEQSIKNINSNVVQSHWKSMINSDNAIIVAVGDFNREKLLKTLEQTTGALGRGQKNSKTFQLDPLELNKKIFHKSQKEQTHIIQGYRGLNFTDSDRDALEVMKSILAGQGGRLFLELRDKASLAYSVSPINMEGIEGGYFGVYIGCSPDKSSKALDMIQIELDKLINHMPPHEEVERAKKYLAGRNHIDLQRNGAQASSILFDELYGLDCHHAFNYSERIKHIKAEDIQALAKRLFKAPSVTVAVGPVSPGPDFS